MGLYYPQHKEREHRQMKRTAAVSYTHLGAYNFMIVSGKDTFGFFIDYSGTVTFDCGYTDLDTLRITVAAENYDLYIIEGESLSLIHIYHKDRTNTATLGNCKSKRRL